MPQASTHTFLIIAPPVYVTFARMPGLIVCGAYQAADQFDIKGACCSLVEKMGREASRRHRLRDRAIQLKQPLQLATGPTASLHGE